MESTHDFCYFHDFCSPEELFDKLSDLKVLKFPGVEFDDIKPLYDWCREHRSFFNEREAVAFLIKPKFGPPLWAVVCSGTTALSCKGD